MKTKLLRLLSGLALIAGGLAGLDLTGATAIFPAEYRATILSAALIIGGSKDFIIGLGDQLDDGVKNGSFKLLPVLFWFAAPVLAFAMLTGCVQTTAKDGSITREPDRATIGLALDFFSAWAPPPKAPEVDMYGRITPDEVARRYPVTPAK